MGGAFKKVKNSEQGPSLDLRPFEKIFYYVKDASVMFHYELEAGR